MEIELSLDHQEFTGTPPKINIEPENDGLEENVPFLGVHSQVPCYSSEVHQIITKYTKRNGRSQNHIHWLTTLDGSEIPRPTTWDFEKKLGK